VLTIGSLFSGAGGLDLAVLDVLGGEFAWHCEYEPPTDKTPRPTQGAAKVLAHHWPDVPNLGDITAVDWPTVEPVDVLTGGFPCQDISGAGKKRGLRPGTRSGLWSHMAYVVDQLRPRLVLIENVRTLLSADAHCDLEPCPWCLGGDRDSSLRALGAVLGDLADLGYDAVWCGLPAAAVGAPHERYRVFVLAAHPNGVPWPLLGNALSSSSPASNGLGSPKPGRRRGPAADTTGAGWRGPRDAGTETGQRGSSDDLMLPSAVALLPTPTATRAGHNQSPSPGAAIRPSLDTLVREHTDWGPYAAAIARWESVLGRPGPPPTITGARGGRKLNPDLTDWLMGWPAGWTDVPGVSANARLRIGGNGVVPQQGSAALRWLLPRLLDGRTAA
jgi:DNA (cytosine-5)-methyltransferase 1